MNKLQVLAKRSLSFFGGATNLFGSIASHTYPATKADFIPVDNEGGTLDLKGVDVPAQWLGLQSKMMQYWAYRYCAPLASVIDRLAEADTNGRIQFLNDDEKNSRVKQKQVNKNPTLFRIHKLLRNPNPWQTWEQFNSEQIVYCKIFGYCPVLAIAPTGMDKSYTKYLFNINPFYADPTFVYDLDIFSITDDSQFIKEWSIKAFGKHIATIPGADILLIRESFTDDGNGLPISKVAGLDYFISNICAAMEADNVLLKKKGPLGIFSSDPKPDISGWIPLTEPQKKELQKDLSQYGLTLGQLQYVISKTPLKWNPMSFNVRDLMTKETVRQGTDGICDRFGYPAELMSGKNATYENRSSAERFLYQTTIIPFSLRRMAQYDKFFGIEDFILFMDFDHLPVLQEDVMKAATARKNNSDSLFIDWQAGMIDYNEYRILQKLEEIPGMTGIFYADWLQLPQNKNLPINKISSDAPPSTDSKEKAA